MPPFETRQRQGFPCPGHGHVVQPPRRVGILIAADVFPTAVQHGHMVELESLGAVGGQQQEPALPPAYVASPLGQPFDEVAHRRFRAAALQSVFFDGLPQELVPGTGRVRFRPIEQGRAVHEPRVSLSQPFDEVPGFTQPPETRDLLVAHLCANAIGLAEGLAERQHGSQILPAPARSPRTAPSPSRAPGSTGAATPP